MPNYTIRPVYWEHKINKKGLAPIMILVTINRAKRAFKTGFSIRPEEWKNNQVSGRANAAMINRSIRDKINAIEADLLAREAAGEVVTGRNIKSYRKINVYDYIEEVMKNMPAPTQRRYRCESGRLKNFAGSTLFFTDINIQFLRDFERHERDRGMEQNTLNTTFKWLKSIMNKARKEKIIKELPEYQTPEYLDPERVYLVESEREEWLKYWREKKVDGSAYLSLSWFLFGCYTGLRHSDWEQFDYSTRVEGEFLKLRARKNGEWVVLPIGKTLAEIIEVVKNLPKPLSGDKTRAYLKILSGRIPGTKEVTTHTGRHTFGAMCAQLRLPRATTAQLLGITEKVAKVYYHLTGVDIIEQAAALKGV